MGGAASAGGGGGASRGQYHAGSCAVTFERAGSARVKLIGDAASSGKARNIFNKTFDFGEMGIGESQLCLTVEGWRPGLLLVVA